MKRLWIVLCAAAALVFFTAPPAPAATVEAGSYSAEVPEGWESEAVGGIAHFFTAPNDACTITIIDETLELPSQAAMFKAREGEGAVRSLGEGQGYLFDKGTGARIWEMVTDGGLYFLIQVDKPCDGIEDFVKGLKWTEESADMGTVFKALANPAVAEWLSFKAPALAKAAKEGLGSEEEIPSEDFTGQGISASVPQGWKVDANETMVTFAAPDEKEFLTIRVLATGLGEDADSEEFEKFAMPEIEKLEGRNVSSLHGTLNFNTENGLAGYMEPLGEKCLLVIFSGNSPALDVVKSSVGLEAAE
jgi:hypothetical protein